MQELLLSLIFVSLFLAGCIDGAGPGAGTTAPSVQATSTLKEMSVQELKAQLADKDFFFLDVHIPEQQHIPGTDDFIPFDEITANISRLPQNKDAKIVVYCRSDNMSGIAGQELVALGYANVYNLVGGKIAWDALESSQ